MRFNYKNKQNWSDFKMEYEKIKQLMEDVGNSKLTSIDIEFPDGTII